MRLTDDGNAYDEIAKNHLKVIAEKQATRVDSLGEIRIYGSKFVNKLHDAPAEVLVAGAQQDDCHHQHEQRLYGIGVYHGIGTPKHHVTKHKCDHHYQYPPFAHIQCSR